MYRIICLVMALCSSLATDVTVYSYSDFFSGSLMCWRLYDGYESFYTLYKQDFADPQKLEPVAVSQFPWEFDYVGSALLYINIFISNKSPNVTAINVTLTADDTTFEMLKTTQTVGKGKGQEYYYIFFDVLHIAEIQIQLNLYSSNMVCSSFIIAKGRKIEKVTKEPLKKEYPNYHNCGYGCAVVVDLVKKCVGPPLVTRTTMKPFPDVVNSTNKTLTTNVLETSLDEHVDTTTVKNAANTTNADHTDYTIIIIISSIFGTLLILLLLILAIRKRCWCKRSPSGTPQLPPYEPFYLNMLFRRECEQEIAEIDQHQYEEIISRVTEGS